MKKRNRILLAGLVVILIGGLVWMAWPEPREPVYHGKKLSAWLQDYWSTGPTNRLPEIKSWERYNDAVSSIDTNAIPFLLDLFKRPAYSPLRTKLVDWANRHRNLFGRYFLTEYDRERMEVDMCGALGKKAKPILPDLLVILKKSNDAGKRYTIVECLPYLASDLEDVRPALLNALKDSDRDVRFCAASGLAEFRSDARGVIPLLVEYADNETNSWQKSYIREAIKRIDPEAASPAGVK